MWFLNRSDTNRPVQSQKRARSLKFWIQVEEELYYPSSENKGADQLRGYREADLRLCFRLCRLLVFPWGGSNVGIFILLILMYFLFVRILYYYPVRYPYIKNLLMKVCANTSTQQVLLHNKIRVVEFWRKPIYTCENKGTDLYAAFLCSMHPLSATLILPQR